MLIVAMILITGAFLFYTVGVWGEHIQKTLKNWHLGFFYLGLFCDVTGTYLMKMIATTSGGDSGNHGLTGTIALVLMLIHAGWATWVLVKKNETMLKNFHKFSVGVWIIWLIPYLVGMISNIAT